MSLPKLLLEYMEFLVPKRKTSKKAAPKKKLAVRGKGARAFTFDKLVSTISGIHESLANQAAKAVNISLTLRNWLIGFHIAEYELHGEDRADYGQKLFSELAKELQSVDVSNSRKRQLYYYLSFYRTYPQIVRTLSAQLKGLLPASMIRPKKVRTPSAQFQADPQSLIKQLSYSHFELLVEIDDEAKRAFYEHECIQGNWSVRELKRQIDSLYYERTGLSKNKAKLKKLVHSKTERASAAMTVRDPYIFEFLGLKPKEVVSESHLEDALLDKLQDFLLELGHGFCFEARQKRILIGGEHFFVDLVFYHRILKCHVLIEMKLDDFKHEHLGQLNTYVNWYRQHEMPEGDNPPLGILLCTRKNHALVEYALAGMDNKLFVKKYKLELPKKKEIEKFLEAELKTSTREK